MGDFGNPHALDLLGKPLLPEFTWYRDHVGKIASFADSLHWAWRFSDHDPPFPWPDRPQLPSRGLSCEIRCNADTDSSARRTAIR